MDLTVEDTTAWSKATFGSVCLGDKRLPRRLTQIEKQLSSMPVNSLSGRCEGKDSLFEGSYPFLRKSSIISKITYNGVDYPWAFIRIKHPHIKIPTKIQQHHRRTHCSTLRTA